MWTGRAAPRARGGWGETMDGLSQSKHFRAAAVPPLIGFVPDYWSLGIVGRAGLDSLRINYCCIELAIWDPGGGGGPGRVRELGGIRFSSLYFLLLSHTAGNIIPAENQSAIPSLPPCRPASPVQQSVCASGNIPCGRASQRQRHFCGGRHHCHNWRGHSSNNAKRAPRHAPPRPAPPPPSAARRVFL